MVFRVHALVRKFTLTCFLGCVMCDVLLCCANPDDSERFCMWRKMIFVCRACAVLCCAHFCVNLPRLLLRTPLQALKVQPDAGEQTLETVTL